MDILNVIKERRSTRAFKPDPVPKEILQKLLETCLWAPSSRNQQSWEFAIITGPILDKFKQINAEKIKAKEKPAPDLSGPELTGVYLERAEKLRDGIDSYQFPSGTEDLEKKRADYWVKGGCFYYAPTVILLQTDKSLGPKAIFDGGIMAQTICLAAMSYGLGTCITLRGVAWPEIFRDELGIPENKIIMVAISIGYPDPEGVVNTYKRSRDSLDAFASWNGFK
jgi:nitroreductase